MEVCYMKIGYASLTTGVRETNFKTCILKNATDENLLSIRFVKRVPLLCFSSVGGEFLFLLIFNILLNNYLTYFTNATYEI